MSDIKIINIKEYNTWTVWNIANNKEYHKKIKDFLIKNLKLKVRESKNTKRSNNLIEFGTFYKKKGKETKFKCVFLMTSNPAIKDYIFLNMIKRDPKLEAKVDKKIRHISKEKVEKYKQHYYKVSFNKNFEINKRELARVVGLDYDNMQYRVIKIPGSEGGTMIVFKHAIEFLAYPSRKSFEKDLKKVLQLIKKNTIKVIK